MEKSCPICKHLVRDLTAHYQVVHPGILEPTQAFQEEEKEDSDDISNLIAGAALLSDFLGDSSGGDSSSSGGDSGSGFGGDGGGFSGGGADGSF